MLGGLVPRRLCARPTRFLTLALFVISLFWILSSRSLGDIRGVARPVIAHGGGGSPPAAAWDAGAAAAAPVAPAPPQADVPPEQAPLRPAGGEGAAQESKPAEIGTAANVADEDKKKKQQQEQEAERARQERERKEHEMRVQFEAEYAALETQKGAGAIYGNTLATLANKTAPRSRQHEAALKPAKAMADFSRDKPDVFNPYPDYNGKEWAAANKAEFVPCEGPDGAFTEADDIQTFRGTPHDFPPPAFGSFDVLNIDGNLCFERETRLGPYGFPQTNRPRKTAADWDKVSWGQLQERCMLKNKARFDLTKKPNPFLKGVYDAGELTQNIDELRRSAESAEAAEAAKESSKLPRRDVFRGEVRKATSDSGAAVKEERTALLIRTYTGKTYSENDKQILRSLVTELSLRTGGQYQVFLLVHVKDAALSIWDDEETYQYVLRSNVPAEFASMTILWNDKAVQTTYPKLDPEKVANVHIAQWLSVQKFAQEYPEFDYVWNWELDSRLTGHHYDYLERLVAFAKKQPRRGLWERNERYYMPAVHGDYDTDFRKEVERVSGKDTVWGPPKLPFVNPVGPKPPVARPEDDDYRWGVGEEADVVTLAPMFIPAGSGWINWDYVWGFNDSAHASAELPQRTTIITQSRVSKRLLDIMHVENLRGNHVYSESTTQTLALLHGLKAVYAPMPVYFDRAWPAASLAKWFNGGPHGDSGGFGSAMAWGHEGRFSGSTWYYRANPPQRLYLNWMGWEDTGIGGPAWEATHGRPCLPPVLLHPIKDVEPTTPGYRSESWLPYS